MKPKIPKVKREIPPDQLNLSIRRDILRMAGGLLGAMIAEYICYRYNKNDKKKVWLKTDWIHDAVPYVSRAAIAKKLEKLTKGKYPVIHKENGKGRQYHKCRYAPSDDVLSYYLGEESLMGGGKVYYNKEIAKEHLEASVVYATILNILKAGEDALWTRKHGFRTTVELKIEDGKNRLVLDYKKLAEGSGLTIYAIRRGVKWLRDNKIIEAKKQFGNKLEVWLCEPDEPPTERTRHDGDEPEDRTEY